MIHEKNLRLYAVNESAAGVSLAIIAFILVFSSLPLNQVAAATTSGPLFSFTLLAPTTNPVRRQYAAIISNSFQQAGMSVNLVYVTFAVLDTKLFPSSCPCGQSYAQGGFDAAFIGWGGGAPIPDWRLVTHYHTEVPPPTGNYANFSNKTIDALIDQYQSTTDPVARTTLGQQIIVDVNQQSPYLVIYYPADQYAFKNYISTWGQSGASSKYTESNIADFEHWVLAPGSGNVANVAVPGQLNDLNALPSSTSNTIYNLWGYGATEAGLQVFDPRTGGYDNGLATSISPSSDLLTWTINFKSATWQDSATVTADDFLFYYQSSLRNDGVSVNEGSFQSFLGLDTSFTYLNGTTHYIMNGTYTETKPAAWKTANSTFTSLSPTSFKFTMPAAYVFTNPVLTGVLPLPIHVLGGIPESKWDSLPVMTGQTNTPSTITWNTALYGGNGSFKYFYGIMGAGPYVFKGYDPVAQVATLQANPNYYNATGLQGAGWFGVKTVHIDVIVDPSGALAAFGNNQVNVLDTNYQFSTANVATVQGDAGYVTKTVSASAGMQQMGVNMNNPVFGTGTGTPNGQTDPSHAARYATDVRTAMSYLIPRTYIIQNLVSGAGQPGITEMPPTFASLYSGLASGVTSTPYDPTQAAKYLGLAGYGAYAAPPPGGTTATTPVQVTAGNITVSAPSFLLGQSITFTGTFTVDPIKGAADNGYAITLEQSTDNKTFTPLLWTSTTSGGYYLFTYTPTQTGTFYYRVFFTGIPMTTVNRDAINNVQTLYSFLIAGAPQNDQPTAYSAVSTYNIGSLPSTFNSLATSISTALSNLAKSTSTALGTVTSEIAAANTAISTANTNIGTANTNIGSVQTSVNNVNSQVSTLTTVAYAALGVAIVLGLLAIALSLRKRGS